MTRLASFLLPIGCAAAFVVMIDGAESIEWKETAAGLIGMCLATSAWWWCADRLGKLAIEKARRAQ